jgi:hypothetical protein
VGASLLGAAGPVGPSANGSRPDIPAELKPWSAWVLKGHESKLCPPEAAEQDSASESSDDEAGGEGHLCVWPGRLDLTLEGKGGRFTLRGKMLAPGFLPLPGDAERWPFDVRVNDHAAVLLSHENVPSLYLQPGPFVVSGAFLWDELPASLAVPEGVGLVGLSIEGKRVPTPRRKEGELLLEKGTSAVSEERVEVQVLRRVVDEVPLQLMTRVKLAVSGRGREVSLGQALPAGFVPMSVQSPIPAQLHPDGHLSVEARPGDWTIEIAARRDGPVTELQRPDPQGLWAAGPEVWAFEARPSLRLVVPEGVEAVDPQQTLSPAEWKSLPTLLMKVGDVLRLNEKRRGNAEPSSDQLSLSRQLWLDFDGSGFTVSDTVTGELNQGWRLEMPNPMVLGHVAIDGRDQLITRRGSNAPAGVELRQGNLRLEADSRWTGETSDVPAVGWDHDFKSVSGNLNLPPGWRLFHLWGVDETPATWVKSWDLLDLFLVLVLVFAVGKLWGSQVAALAAVTLVLTFPEAGTPKWIWLFLVATEALVRVLPEGLIRQAFRAGRILSLGVWAIVALPFMTEQIRKGIYPALEKEYESAGGFRLGGGGYLGAESRSAAPMAPPASVAGKPEANEASFDKAFGGDTPRGATSSPAPGPAPKKEKYQRSSVLEELPSQAMIQTGPGVPKWSWNTVPLRWNGPVEKTQHLHLWLMSPGLNVTLAFLRVALLGALLALLLRRSKDWWRSAPPAAPRAAPAAAMLGVVLMVGLHAGAARAETQPSDERLNELRSRLLEPPKCGKACVTLGKLNLEAEPTKLTLRFDVSAAAPAGVPLPSAAEGWSPEQVLLDGKPTDALLRGDEGRLVLQVEAGTHEVQLLGPLPQADTVQLAFPLKPHHVTSHLGGWSLEGVHEDGVPDGTLQLTRLQKEAPSEGKPAVQTTAFPPYASVERTLVLGLEWAVETRVTRLTPVNAAIVLEVPLLPGEAVTSSDVRTARGNALVNLAAGATEVSWRSTLKAQSPLKLEAMQKASWTEVWKLNAGPIWHLGWTGIPPVHPVDAQAAHLPEWRPYPGESLVLTVERPEGFAGQTLTVDQSRLSLAPGLRATDATLQMTLRSSQGGQHVVTVPDGATVESVAINGQSQPVRQDGRSLTLPVSPGAQGMEVKWREKRSVTALFSGSEVNLGAPSVNAELEVDLPRDRWVLLLGGPRLGPAVLFWGVLVAVLVAAALLGRVKMTPLTTLSWALLGVGLSQVPIEVSWMPVAWLIAMGWRRSSGAQLTRRWFNAVQVLLALGALASVCVLFAAVEAGLLGQPDMQITGNSSSAYALRWFADRSAPTLPRPWLFSAPMMVYRGAMLAWALWLARTVLGWTRWAWEAFASGGLWRRRPAKATLVAPPPTP